MKPRTLALFTAFSLLLIPLSAIAVPGKGNGQGPVRIPAHAREIAPGLFDLGTTADGIQGYAFVDYRKGFSHKAGHSKGGGGCYELFAQGARWKTTKPYLVNPTNGDSLSGSFVLGALAAATMEWEAPAGFNIFGAGSSTSAPLAPDFVTPDGDNEVLFATLGDPNVIALTVVWGIFGGPKPLRELVEWDMVFNDTGAFDFGDAIADPSLIDFLSTATHELGHAVGFAHANAVRCPEETMHPFIEFGETNKRDLHSGDIKGVTRLY